MRYALGMAYALVGIMYAAYGTPEQNGMLLKNFDAYHAYCTLQNEVYKKIMNRVQWQSCIPLEYAVVAGVSLKNDTVVIDLSDERNNRWCCYLRKTDRITYSLDSTKESACFVSDNFKIFFQQNRYGYLYDYGTF